jgi:hypothetical protein
MRCLVRAWVDRSLVWRLGWSARLQRGERGFWPSGFWPVRRYSIYGEGSYYPGLLAETRGGTVVAFHVRYPAGGD